jgi:long-chain fatty acid transport protein
MQVDKADVDEHIIRFGLTEGAPGTFPLLIFNGIGANLELVTPFSAALAKQGIGTVVFDVPGVGGSLAPRLPYRFSSLARLAVGLLKTLAIASPVDALGVSWGGALAQQFAHQYPSQCRRLLLAATSPGAVMVPGRLGAIVKLATPRRYLDRHYMAKIGGEIYGGRFRTDHDLLAKYGKHLESPSGVGYLFQLLAGAGWTSIHWLHRLRQPTLVMMGTDDPIVPVVNGQILARLIPNARLVTIDDGHLFLISSIDEVVPIIREFLMAPDEQDPVRSEEPTAEDPAGRPRFQRGAATAIAFALCSAGLATNARAGGGFQLNEGATDWMANAYAGEPAKAYDASTVFTNPAGMVRLNQSEFDASLVGIFPTDRFSGTNTIDGVPTSGTTSGDFIQKAATAAQFGVLNLTPDFKIGFSATVPFGQRTSYPTDFVGRYQGLVSSITDFQFTVAGSYRINEHWSIGIGPVLNYFNPRFTSALNLGPLGDAYADFHGQNTAFGFNVGLLYQFDENTRIGIDYHSRLQHNLTVHEGFTPPPMLTVIDPVAAEEIAAMTSSGKTTIVLPDYLEVGLYHQFDPRWAGMISARWTNWSRLDSVTITPTNGQPPITFPENWHDTAFVGLGLNYRVTSKLLLQGGWHWDQSPVDDTNRTVRIPDNDRYGIGGGLTYTPLPYLDLQFAYVHLFLPSAKINESVSPSAGVLRGTLSVSDDSVSLGMRVRF